MKKLLFLLVLILGLTACASVGLARDAGYSWAVIDGKTADRVHLREQPSMQAKSLGLYFTGTQVICEADQSKEWTWVNIGTEAGWIKTEYLRFSSDAGSVKPRQPVGKVKNVKAGSWVNLRSSPSARATVEGRLRYGDTVTVLGETVTKWYYVQMGDLYGYVMDDYLSVGGSVSAGTPSARRYEMQYYTYTYNAKSSISIQYPLFEGADKLNKLIYDRVWRMAHENSYETEGLSVYIDYQCAVTLNNGKMISMVFWGASNVEGSIHPYTDLFAFNVDVSTLQEVTFEELYTANAEFERVFFSKAFFPTNPVTSYDAASFYEMLGLQTSEYKAASVFSFPGAVTCFLKPDGIVLSMSAVHATGSDHFEAQLKYSDIQKFYRLKQKYWEN